MLCPQRAQQVEESGTAEDSRDRRASREAAWLGESHRQPSSAVVDRPDRKDEPCIVEFLVENLGLALQAA
jgi:hypothetical protein